MRSTFVLLLAFLSSVVALAAPDAVVVFDLTGSLIQPVPVSEVPKGDKRFIQVGGKAYRIVDTAKETIEALVKNGVGIRIFSDLPAATAAQIISALSLPAQAQSILSNIQSIPRTAVLVTDELAKSAFSSVVQVISTGPAYLSYDSFEESKNTAAEMAAKKPSDYAVKKTFFPPTEEAWKTHKNRLAASFAILKRSFDDALKGGTFAAHAKKYEGSQTLTAWAADGMENLFSSPAWNYRISGTQKRLAGCVLKNSRDQSIAKPTSLEACMAALPTHYGWYGEKPESCALLNADNIVIKAFAPKECIGKLDVTYDWVDPSTKKVCGAFTPKRALITNVDPDECDLGTVGRDLLPCLQTLDRPYRFYHYTTAAKIEATKHPGFSTDESIKQHQRQWSEHFWNTNNAYNGLWTVRDPYTSNGYGEHLFRIEVPAGTRVIPEATIASCAFSQKTVEHLTKKGCPTHPSSLLFQGATPTCTPFLRKIYSSLKIRSYARSFGGTVPGGCEQNGFAYVWLNLADLPDSAFANFPAVSPTSTGAGLSEVEEIESIWREVGQTRWASLTISNQPTRLAAAKSRMINCSRYYTTPPQATSSCADPRGAKERLAEIQREIELMNEALRSAAI